MQIAAECATVCYRKLVGDGGLEPPTSTMSTWRSTPELIALHYLPPDQATRKILKPLRDCKAYQPALA